MADQPVTPIQSKSQPPAENTRMGTDSSRKTYRPIWTSVILNALWTIGQGLVYLVLGWLVFTSVFSKEFNISENVLIVIIYIIVVMAFILTMIYLWDRIKFARTFSITTNSSQLTLQEDKKTIEIPWDEVASFQKYEVVGANQQTISIPEEIRQRDVLKEVIEKNAAKSITEHLISRFNNEGKVTLGIIDITNKGLLIQEQFIPWENIVSIEIDEERFLRVIELSDSNATGITSTSKNPNLKTRRIAPASEIPNYYSLGAFVELLRQRPSGVRLIEEPEKQQVVVDKVINASNRDVNRSGININGSGNVIIYSQGNVDVSGIIDAQGTYTTGLSADELKQLFEEIYRTIESKAASSSANQEDLTGAIKEIKSAMISAEEKKSPVDERFLAQRFRHIARIAPDILDVVVATLANPLLGLGVAAKKIADKAKSDIK